MLLIILGIVGLNSGSAYLPPLATTAIIIILISLGMIWLMRQKVGAKMVCETCVTEIAVPTVHCGPGILGPGETNSIVRVSMKVTQNM